MFCILQGFVDPHVHLIPSSLALTDVNLRHVSSKAELIQRVADRAAAAAAKAAEAGADAPWLLGGGWSEHEWGGGLPDASWIDEVRLFACLLSITTLHCNSRHQCRPSAL